MRPIFQFFYYIRTLIKVYTMRLIFGLSELLLIKIYKLSAILNEIVQKHPRNMNKFHISVNKNFVYMPQY